MIEDSSENRYNISCDQCGHEMSDEFIKKNQNQNKPLYCELCGAQINLNPSEKEEISKRKRKGEIITQHEEKEVRFSYITKELRQEIINYVYQKTYELLKTTPFVIKRLKQQKDMKHFQKIKLAKKLRRILLSTSLPTHGLEQLTKISQKKIENYFDNFKSGLKTRQKFQPKIHPRIIKNIEFGFRLINGDFELSTLSKDNQKAVKNLLHTHGFKINIKMKNSFSYQLSLFICRQIYKKITTHGHVLELLPNRNQLTKHYIFNTAKDMVALILNDLLKRRFSRHYRTLKKILELDWVYRESLINHICSLVKLVYKLTFNIGDKPKLNGFERLIVEDLKKSKFFENDEYFTPEFKVNLTLILCRIIYKIIESNSNLNSQEQRYKKLNVVNKDKMLNIILEEILVKNEINTEFLKKFYKLSVEEFQKEYDKFQAKMITDIIYKENFRMYLFQLIKIINKITQWRSKKSKHTKIELAIIKDCSNYNFMWDNNQIDPRECFIRKEKKKFFNLDKDNQSINVDTIDKQKLSNVIENKTRIYEKEKSELKILSQSGMVKLNNKQVSEENTDIKLKAYTTLKLIKDIRENLPLLSEDLALIFPFRVDRFNFTDLSEYWGFSSGYIAELKYLYKKNPNNFKVDKKKLMILEEKIKNNLGAKAIGGVYLFNKFRVGELSFWDLIESLRLELGRTSGLVKLTNEELNDIFGFMVDDLIQRITNPNKKYYNPNYEFSLNKLDNILARINEIFAFRAGHIHKFIDKYKMLNPNLKEYSLQAHNVKDPHYFSTIKSGEIIKAYLFGFLMADGYIESNGWGIGIELRSEDENLLFKFKEAIGIDKDIKQRTIFKRYKGRINIYIQSRLRFGCVPMWNDLNNLGYSSSKSLRKSVPNVIKDLLYKAKQESGSKWFEKISGQTALAWLLGFYDGDGNFIKTGRGYANLYSASEEFLNDIKNTFGFEHVVQEKETPGDISHVFDEERVSEGYYYLLMDNDIFEAMLNSYFDSLPRKRPEYYDNSFNFLRKS